jgi:hypothetical protein
MSRENQCLDELCRRELLEIPASLWLRYRNLLEPSQFHNFCIKALEVCLDAYETNLEEQESNKFRIEFIRKNDN